MALIERETLLLAEGNQQLTAAVLLGRRHRTVNPERHCTGTLRVTEDMQLRDVEPLYEIIRFFKEFLALAAGTNNHIHANESIGQQFAHSRYLLRKEFCIVTAVHKFEHLVTTCLQRNVEMRHKAARLRNILYYLIGNEVGFY